MIIFPCEFCDRIPPCPCITERVAVRRAQRCVDARHRAAVELARVSDRLIGHRKAA